MGASPLAGGATKSTLLTHTITGLSAENKYEHKINENYFLSFNSFYMNLDSYLMTQSVQCFLLFVVESETQTYFILENNLPVQNKRNKSTMKILLYLIIYSDKE